LFEAQPLVMSYEAVSSLKQELQVFRSKLSPILQAMLDRGAMVSDADYRAALAQAARSRDEMGRLLDSDGVILTFSTAGEAPLMTAGTGTAIFNRVWSLLGMPAITLPCGRGRQGLPLGIQLVAAVDKDDALLASAAAVELALASRPSQIQADFMETHK
jgi:Asp-tRNA(Asn)/Glu-tRNA(Gln) amidotransferase A subunit family amidase